MKLLRGLGLLGLAALLVAGCGGGKGGNSNAHMRFMNTYVDATTVGISLDNNVIVTEILAAARESARTHQRVTLAASGTRLP